MTNDEAKPVVVGIDGSDAAIEAARWAIGEAVARDVPLRLISVANTPRTLVDWELRGPEAQYAEASLRAASAAVDSAGLPVKIEAEVLWGPPSNALIRESEHAAMICIGTVGIGAVARVVLGSTAVAVAERADCAVAVIRPAAVTDRPAENWVAVGVNDQPEADFALRVALDEARIRRAPLVAVGLGCNAFGVNSVEQTEHRIQRWRQQYPDVRIDVVSASAGLAEFLADNRSDLAQRYASTDRTHDAGHVQPLAVLASSDVAEVMRIVGPHDHPILKHAQCSVLVAR
jgi:nucleotide-binding universal stress UspA family protein